MTHSSPTKRAHKLRKVLLLKHHPSINQQPVHTLVHVRTSITSETTAGLLPFCLTCFRAAKLKQGVSQLCSQWTEQEWRSSVCQWSHDIYETYTRLLLWFIIRRPAECHPNATGKLSLWSFGRCEVQWYTWEGCFRGWNMRTLRQPQTNLLRGVTCGELSSEIFNFWPLWSSNN